MFEIRSSLNQKDGLLSQRIYHNQLLFSMTNSLCLLLILSHQIRRWRKFWKHIIDSINLTHHLQQEEKSGKRLPAVPFSNLWMVVKPSPVNSATSFWVRLHLILYSLNLTPSKRTNSGVEYSYKSAIIFY